MALKGVIVFALARGFGVGRAPALEAALLLGPCGEFAFVILGSAATLGMLPAEAGRDALLVVTLTMMAIPLMAWLGRRMASRIRPSMAVPGEAAAALPDDSRPSVIVAGFGRVGHLIGAMLDEHKIAYLAVDYDAELVARERKNGFPVYYGDAANPEFLRKCPGRARHLPSPWTIGPRRRCRAPPAPSARSQDRRPNPRRAHAMNLYGGRAGRCRDDRSSLQLGESLLVEAGVPTGLAIASVHERRDGFRKLLGRPNRREDMATARKRLRRRRSIT
jgi:CPA2 family monovalent cation:H+ antiporter-2